MASRKDKDEAQALLKLCMESEDHSVPYLKQLCSRESIAAMKVRAGLWSMVWFGVSVLL